MPKPPPSSSSIPSLPTSSPPSHSLDYKASCPQLPLYCPHCSTSTTVRGRFKAYKLGRGLRTHIGLKHDMKHDSACSSNDSQSSKVEECEEWVNRWITEVVIPKKYKSDVPPCYFKTSLLIPTIEKLSVLLLPPLPPPSSPSWSPQSLTSSTLTHLKTTLHNLTSTTGLTPPQILSTPDHHHTTTHHWSAGVGNILMYKYISSISPYKQGKFNKRTGKNPLHYAARYGRFEMCEYLKSEFEDKKSGDGTSCLMMAVYGGSIDCINLLGGEELYEDENDWGCTCTHFAGLSKNIEVVEYFNKIGVDWMKKQKNGHTAIDKAAIVGWRKGIERMWKGEDIDLTGKWKGGSKEDRRWLIEKGLLRDDNDDNI